MYNRLDRIPACDGQTDGRTDGQTSCHGIVHAMHTRRAVKMKEVVLVATLSTRLYAEIITIQ